MLSTSSVSVTSWAVYGLALHVPYRTHEITCIGAEVKTGIEHRWTKIVVLHL